jgi:hypothetical protein
MRRVVLDAIRLPAKLLKSIDAIRKLEIDVAGTA